MDLSIAMADIDPGGWAVAVSGGADSVALLHLLMRHRPDLRLHVVHLDHQTRSGASGDDAAFVARLAERYHLPAIIAQRGDIEPALPDLPANRSARFRLLRHALFQRVVVEHRLEGVLLAHHADDQAETVFHRLLRQSRWPRGMSGDGRVNGLRLVRPLLGVRRQALRDSLQTEGHLWREDASNQSEDYLRNRIRQTLAAHSGLVAPLLEVHERMTALRKWVKSAAPVLDPTFSVASVQGLPEILARESAGRWLAGQGIAVEALTPAVIDRLLAIINDAAAPHQVIFPTKLRVRRRRGEIEGGR